MLPEMYGADGVAREIVRDRERRIAKRQLLSELPPAPPRALALRRVLARAIGVRLVNVGERLRSYGHAEPVNQSWRTQPQS